MKKRRLILLSLVLLIVLMPVTAFGAGVSGALWRGTVRITNSGSTVTDVIATANISSQALIDNGYADDNLSDVAVLHGSTDVPFMPSVNSSYPWAFAVDSISAGLNIDYSLYSGNATGGLIRYFPGDAGMSANYSETLELADNFTIEQSGWVDTNSGGNLLRNYRFGTYATSGNITSAIFDVPTSSTLTANATGNYTAWETLFGKATQWEAVETADADTSYIATASASQVKSAFELISFPIAESDTWSIESVTVSIRARNTDNTYKGYVQPYLRLSAVETSGNNTQLNSASYYTISENVTRPGGGSWQYDDLASLQVAVGGTSAATYPIRVTQVYVTVNYIPKTSPLVSVTAPGISSGNMTVRTTANVTDLMIYIGDDLKGSTALTANVTDNPATGWTYYENMGGYWEYTKIWCGETLQQHIEWEYDDQEFHDRSYQAVDFDGVDDTVIIPHDANQLLTTGGSIEAWIKPNGTGESTSGRIIDKSADALSTNGFYIATATAVFFRINAGTYINSAAGSITYGNWYHVVVSWDNTGLTTIYVNGATSGTPGVSADPVGITAVTDLTIGNRSGGTDRTFDGSIDEVRIYNRALGLSEIQANYASGLGSYTPYSTSGLVGWWHLDDAYGDTATDSSGNGNDGTLTNMDNSDWVNGKVAKPVGTEGNNDVDPIFRTASSDNISASLISFNPVHESEVSTFTLSTSYDILIADATPEGNMFEDGDYSKLPAAPINEMLDTADVPRAAWWFPFIFMGICVIGFIVYGATTLTRGPSGRLSEGQIDGSLLIMFIVMEALLVLFGKLGPIPLWPSYLFPLAGLSLILSRKHFAWG